MCSKHEGEGPELLSVCGELLYLLCQGEALQQALHDLAALDCHALEEGTVVRVFSLNEPWGRKEQMDGRACVAVTWQALLDPLECHLSQMISCLTAACCAMPRPWCCDYRTGRW